MARVNNKGKGSGGIQSPTKRKLKDIHAKKTLDRKMDHQRKTTRKSLKRA